MKRIFIIILIALSCTISFAKTTYVNSILVAKLPPNWKVVTQSQSKNIRLTEYIPQHEKPNQHSKIIAQAVIRKSDDAAKAFSLYHQYKIIGFNRRGCEIKPMITDAFRNRHQHYEVFTYECANDNASGVDLIYDADKTSIYDLMYEFASRTLSADQINEAINTLKDFKVCYEGDNSCINSN